MATEASMRRVTAFMMVGVAFLWLRASPAEDWEELAAMGALQANPGRGLPQTPLSGGEICWEV
jgi:hypothetical protein